VVPQVEPAATPEPFHWRQLDAPDFPGFVANLRSIGCPEATIRDIVTGELTEIYNQRTPEQPADAYHSSSPAFVEHIPAGGTTPAASDAPEIQQVLVEVLGTPKLENDTVMAAPAVASTQAATSPVTDVADIPAAFLVGNAPGQSLAGTTELSTTVKDSSLTPETVEQLTRMRNDFANAVADSGGETSGYTYSSASAGMSSVSPGDYYRRWLKAKRDSDEVFSSIYGGDALISAQQQALIEASAQQAAK
jgi:hypothetical protein